MTDTPELVIRVQPGQLAESMDLRRTTALAPREGRTRPRTPQARFDADGLPRGLMPVAGIRCGEWL